jgi:hypothetical protein
MLDDRFIQHLRNVVGAEAYNSWEANLENVEDMQVTLSTPSCMPGGEVTLQKPAVQQD